MNKFAALTLPLSLSLSLGLGLLNGARAAPLPMASPVESDFSTEGLDRQNRFLPEKHDKAQGYFDRSNNTPMPIDAVFGLASMTKIMAIVAALQLHEQGRLPLDPVLRPILIHDLFRHTSGLTYGGRVDHPISKLYPGGIQPAMEGNTTQFIDQLNQL